jgi:hypothetical protein
MDLTVGKRVIFNRGDLACSHGLEKKFGVNECLKNGCHGTISGKFVIFDELVYILLDNPCPCYPYHIEFNNGLAVRKKGTKCLAWEWMLLPEEMMPMQWRPPGRLYPEDAGAL